MRKSGGTLLGKIHVSRDFHGGFHFLHGLIGNARGPVSPFFHNFLSLFWIFKQSPTFFPDRGESFHHGIGYLPAMIALRDKLHGQALEWARVPMLARWPGPFHVFGGNWMPIDV